MLLSGEEIQKNLGGNIIIEPYHPSQLNPNSYNLRLSNELLPSSRRKSLYSMLGWTPVLFWYFPESYF